MKKALKWIAQIMIIGAIFFFIGKKLYINWQQLVNYEWDFNYVYLIIAFIALISTFILSAIGWRITLNILGEEIRFRKSLEIWFLSSLGKYLPGKIWLILGRVYLCGKEGISKSNSFISSTLEQMFAIISGVLLFALSLPFWEYKKVSSMINLYFLFLIPLGLLLLYPPLLSRIGNWILALLKRGELEINIKYRQILVMISYFLAIWVIHTMAFFLLVNAIYHVSFDNYLTFAGIFAISVVIGFLSVFVPSGLGVREGMLTFLLAFYIPASIAAIIALVARIWYILTELFCIGIFSLPSTKIRFIKRKIDKVKLS